ncbi:MAG: acetyl-CoA carboxylase biotin carboxyl carrier protein [Verrucomicrobiaceae bacterium]|nr:MAG: acetyl-CoA carboxylase biotin carboxyl carrier protein [Verrucomicrobiaceae bacterium]
MDLKEIRTLIDLMKKNGIGVFKMEREGFKITLKTGEAGRPVQFVTSGPAQAIAAPVAQPCPAGPVSASPAPEEAGIEIKSPMVGTFYGSPSPDAASFVSVGQQITGETVVCIIEAMKVMNEIKAEVSGTVVEICAENGKPVQFGQTLFRLK